MHTYFKKKAIQHADGLFLSNLYTSRQITITVTFVGVIDITDITGLAWVKIPLLGVEFVIKIGAIHLVMMSHYRYQVISYPALINSPLLHVS